MHDFGRPCLNPLVLSIFMCRWDESSNFYGWEVSMGSGCKASDMLHGMWSVSPETPEKSLPWCLYVGCSLYYSASSRAKRVNTEPGFVRAWERGGLSKSTWELCSCVYTQKRCLCNDTTLLLLSCCYDHLHEIKISIPSVSSLTPPQRYCSSWWPWNHFSDMNREGYVNWEENSEAAASLNFKSNQGFFSCKWKKPREETRCRMGAEPPSRATVWLQERFLYLESPKPEKYRLGLSKSWEL